MSVKPEGLLGDIKTANVFRASQTLKQPNVFHHPVKAKI